MQDKEHVKDFTMAEYINLKNKRKKWNTIKGQTAQLGKKLLRKIGLLDWGRSMWHKLLYPYHINFGCDNEPYQSFPMLNIKGARPTDRRINAYKILDILNQDMNVLDIGCNIGFFDMTIAKYVHTILGIDYDKGYIDIANKVAKKLEITNVKFISGDFNVWYRNNKKKFNVIFAFAVHSHLKIRPLEYVRILSSLLYPGGFIFFESHGYGPENSELTTVKEIEDALIAQGFSKQYEVVLDANKDEAIDIAMKNSESQELRRIFMVLKKERSN